MYIKGMTENTDGVFDHEDDIKSFLPGHNYFYGHDYTSKSISEPADLFRKIILTRSFTINVGCCAV